MMNRGIEVFTPTSYLESSNWLFQETKGAKWTAEENKRFENALALYDKDTPDRWSRVAAMIPGKTVGDIMKQYKELEEDVSDIEAGLIPIPGYASDSFTLDWGGYSDGFCVNGFGNYFLAGGKRGISTRPSEHERKKGIPWTEEEHRLFLMGLKKYGKGDWRNISRNFVTSRTPTQVASHAQKYFIRQLTGGKDKRRSSIHDITTVNVTDAAAAESPDNNSTSSTNHSTSAMPQQQPGLRVAATEMYERKPVMESVFFAGDANELVDPFHGFSWYVPELQGQNLVRKTFNGLPQLEPYNGYLQMQQQ